ncbi:FAD dependent oxidoreductase [Hysterangium stoloniferum]|nr:FAD dependent oxidoreductase [Hysterangium stoloniferum]
MPDASPKFPHPNPTISFWLQGTRSSRLIGHRTTERLPATADVVLIGAGLSGVATAYFLLTGPDPPSNVVILEAREAGEGATGRNGGHCRPNCYAGYTEYKAQFGKEQAFKILANEMDTLNLTQEIIEKENIDCDFWRGYSLDVAMTQNSADTWAATLAEYIADGANVEGVVEQISDPTKAQEISRCPLAHAIYRFPAASLWPHKLVLGLLSICVDKYGLNLQTNTPVKSVRASGDSQWQIETDRGVITAQKVIYTTNAFTATLLPEFEGKITPIREQCSAIVPTKAYCGRGVMSHTCSFNWGAPDGYDYMVQRPKDGIFILGGGRCKVPIQDTVNQTDDSVKRPEITEYLGSALRTHLEGWGEEAVGEGLLCDWTGIICYTPDGVPFVGAVHGKPGAFICAGHCGHGMARIMTCARGIAALVRGEDWSVTGLPECFEPTPERLSLSL